MVVLTKAAHTNVSRSDAQMAKQLKFPPDVDDFIHELIFKALQRKAMKEVEENETNHTRNSTTRF